MIEHAMRYLELGYSVIPLCPPDCAELTTLAHKDHPCSSPGKRPLIHWHTYTQRLPTKQELRVYWNRWPNANIGIVMGSVSRIIGLDIDGHEAETLLQEVLQGPIVTPATFLTPGGGRRIILATKPGDIIPKRRLSRGASHLILLGEGSYTVAPPSIHANGGIYSWTSQSQDRALNASSTGP